MAVSDKHESRLNRVLAHPGPGVWVPVRPFAALIVGLAALVGCEVASAQIYAGSQTADAPVVLSNFRSDSTPVLIVAKPLAESSPMVGGPENGLRQPAVPDDLRRLVEQVAGEVGIDPALLHAVVAVESRYNALAISSRGAMGLMQLMPATAIRFGARHPLDPKNNLLAGAAYLKWLMTVFNDDLELVLAAYNAGEQAVLDAGRRIPPFRETQAYVPRVLAYLRCTNGESCKRS